MIVFDARKQGEPKRTRMLNCRCHEREKERYFSLEEWIICCRSLVSFISIAIQHAITPATYNKNVDECTTCKIYGANRIELVLTCCNWG